MFHCLLSLGGSEWKLESVLYSAIYTGSTPPVFKEGESDCGEEVYISNINNNNKNLQQGKWEMTKGNQLLWLPSVSLKHKPPWAEPNKDTHQCHEMWWNWTQEFQAAIFSEQSDMHFPRKVSLFLIDWSPRTAIQRNTHHTSAYNTTQQPEKKQKVTIMCAVI